MYIDRRHFSWLASVYHTRYIISYRIHNVKHCVALFQTVWYEETQSFYTEILLYGGLYQLLPGVLQLYWQEVDSA